MSRLIMGAVAGCLVLGLAAARVQAAPKPLQPKAACKDGKWAKALKEFPTTLECATARFVEAKVGLRRIVVIGGRADENDRVGRALVFVDGEVTDAGIWADTKRLFGPEAPSARALADVMSLALFANTPANEIAYSTAAALAWSIGSKQQLRDKAGMFVEQGALVLRAYLRGRGQGTCVFVITAKAWLDAGRIMIAQQIIAGTGACPKLWQ